MKKIELLSPGGSFDALKTAVQSGADAVYVGGPMFGARQSAENFTKEALKEATLYCHGYGVDIHVAVNTLVKEKEIENLADYISYLCEINVDAIIVQDIGVAEIIKKICPSMPLHASTQMTVTSLEGVRYLERIGFSRVVLSRELSKEEIAHICRFAKAEIEVFVHGALCMSYSGQCLMSSILGGRSGNRGRCAQPCRLLYNLRSNKDEDNAYVLSPKDLALVKELGTLKKIGVKSLKIEGRLKSSEYVSAVTGIYRKYLDTGEKVLEEDYKELKNAFSRTDFTDGYFAAKLGKDMMCHKNPSNAKKNTFTDAAKKRCQGGFIRKIGVSISAYMEEGKPLSLTIFDDEGNCVTAQSQQECKKAQNESISEDRIKEQLKKLGQTPFEAQSVEIVKSKTATLPISLINETRRNATELLFYERGKRQKKEIFPFEKKQKESIEREPHLVCEVTTSSQLKAAIDCGIEEIVAPKNLIKEAKTYRGTIIQKCTDIFSEEEILTKDIEVSNAAQAFEFGDTKLRGSLRLNIFNSYAADHYSYMQSVTISPELNAKETEDVIKNTKARAGIIAYGRLPLMLMKNCPIKAMGKCANGNKNYVLEDRKKEEFPLLCKEGCKCELVNSKPVFLADKLSVLPKTDFLKLLFTTEGYDDSKKIINLYKDALSGKTVQNPFGENAFTRGHTNRGVL